MPRCARSSEVSRSLRRNRWQHHTAWLMISGGKRQPWSLGAQLFIALL